MNKHVFFFLFGLVWLCCYIPILAQEVSLTPYTFKFDGNPDGYKVIWKYNIEDKYNTFIKKNSLDLDWFISTAKITHVDKKPHDEWESRKDINRKYIFMIMGHKRWPGIDNVWSIQRLFMHDAPEPFGAKTCQVEFLLYPISKNAKPIQNFDNLVDWKPNRLDNPTTIVWETINVVKEHYSDIQKVDVGLDYNETLIPFDCGIYANDSNWPGFPPIMEIQISLDYNIRQHYQIYNIEYNTADREYFSIAKIFDIKDWEGRIKLKNMDIKQRHKLRINLIRINHKDWRKMPINALRGRIKDFPHHAISVGIKYISNPDYDEFPGPGIFCDNCTKPLKNLKE